ncbi:Tetratricopeptide repeat-containing protein [Lentzea waywayandensis]|uniref:Tetratricopeptide repeat-containing protein n=1 Tax=Lentzea waywayandensis TaxID=84724 RepID=A0A1I6DKG1_9PSEU|nr:tetratricopeptide repeat protein [Lentzea waywayandensis]SFR05857.1 Tetratricopeptide repeat-containing protein [Lentzea waywayandensis]
MAAAELSLFGGELRRLRLLAGLSQSRFAVLIHYSKGYLSKVETGSAEVNREFAKACDDALEANGALLELAGDRPRKRSVGQLAATMSGLPPSTPHFVGRSAELARITAFLSAEQGAVACALTGLAGAGKTALALRAAWAVADSFPDGCAYLDLAGHAPEAQAMSARDAFHPLLRMLGVPAEQIPSHPDARANLYRSVLRGKRCLFVLDNVGSARQVAPLLPSEPRCRVIITSRNRLNALDDAVHVTVDVLPAETAVSLFRAIARERAESAPDEVVARVVDRCGRLPLAVRIAAARFHGSPMWTLEEFDERLVGEASRLSALNDGERSVAAAFSLSCQALTAAQLRLFALLALHPGRDVEVRSAAALADLGLVETQRLLDDLGDVHLVSPLGTNHVTVHDLVRAFAGDRLLPGIGPAEQAAALRRLLDHSLVLTESSDEFLAPHRHRLALSVGTLPEVSVKFTERATATAWIDAEWPNLVALCRTAAARGLHDQCWQLAFLLRDFFFLTKLWDVWIDLHLLAADAARVAGDGKALAITLNNLGMAHADRGELAVAIGYYEEALEQFRELEDPRGVTDALSNIAWAALYQGDPGRTMRDLSEARASYLRMNSPRNAAIAFRGMALAEVELGSCDDAVRHAEESEAEFAALGLELDVVMSANCTAWAHFRAGRLDDAAEQYARAVELARNCGSQYEMARATTGLGNVDAAKGHLGAAATHWAAADQLHGGLNDVMVGETRARKALA